MGRVLGFAWWGMVVSAEDISDVSVHGEAAGAVSVVPGEIDASKFCAGPVRGDFVVRGEGLEKVVSVLSADVLDAEIINDKDKHNRALFVSP